MGGSRQRLSTTPNVSSAPRRTPPLGGKEVITVNISRRSFTTLVALGLIPPIGCRATSTREENGAMDKEIIRQLLERLGQALSAGDLKGASSCWGFPALVFFDEGGTAVA